MRKVCLNILCLISALIFFSVGVMAAYPSSGQEIPEGSVILKGDCIGEKNGWDGTESTGRSSAFDGDIYTYYDPSIGANVDYYTGIRLSEPYVLTKVCIMPRENFNDRFDGAMIQGSNDGKKWRTLWQSESEASSWDWQVITDFKNNTGYTYYRYCNDRNHGDVAEVELYGYSGTTGEDPALASATGLNEVTVQFDTCGGDFSAFFPITVHFGENYPEIDYIPVRDGYVFTGWYTSKDGGKLVDAETVVTDPSRHILYAHWITEAEAISRQAAENAEPEDPDDFTDIQGFCVTLSITLVLAAVVAVIALKNKN